MKTQASGPRSMVMKERAESEVSLRRANEEHVQGPACVEKPAPEHGERKDLRFSTTEPAVCTRAYKQVHRSVADTLLARNRVRAGVCTS